MSNPSWQPSPPSERSIGATIVFWGLLAASLIIFAAAAYVFLDNLSAPAPRTDSEVAAVPTSAPVATAATRPQPTEIPIAPLAGNQVNILVMGIDQRPGESVAARTDSMMVISINQESGQLGMLSVPRDIWVPIPGYQANKINTAHFFGESARAGGGPPVAKATMSNLIGQPVQYYVRLNFTAFRTIIDAIGGIDVDVPKDINDYNYPDDNCPDINHCGYSPFRIKAGRQHLDGATALKYARTRYTDSDFHRARRQQQVLLAVRDKVLQAKMIPVLLIKAPLLLDQLSNSLSTDLTLPQMAGLAQMILTNKLDSEHVHQFVIDETMTVDQFMPTGEEALIPNTARIQAAVREYFATLAMPPTPMPPTASPSLQNQLFSEQARVEVLNGTGQVGLARVTGEWLNSIGFVVVNIADADHNDYAATRIIDTGDKPLTREALREVLKLSKASVTTGPRRTTNGAPDITLILGRDFKLPKQ